MHKKFDKIPRWAIDSSDDTFPTLQTEAQKKKKKRHTHLHHQQP